MKLVLFDVDGTLIRSHGVGRRALEQAVRDVTGLPDPLADIRLGGKTDPVILEEAFRRAGLEHPPGSGIVARIFARYLDLLAAGLKEPTRFEVLPGVVALLDALEALPEAFALALGTGNIEPGARLKLQRANLNAYFPTGGFGSDAHDRVDVLHAGVRKAEAFYRRRFSEVWVIGDTPADTAAARAIGAGALVTATGDYTMDDLHASAADAVFADLCDTHAILGVLEGADT